MRLNTEDRLYLQKPIQELAAQSSETVSISADMLKRLCEQVGIRPEAENNEILG